MNGQVQYRGLPAPPHEAVIFEGDGMPPPCPREMYSQAGVYDVIPGDPHNQRRQKKPATPQRSPSTRLSSQSVQDDVFTDHPHSPRQHTSPQQFTHHQQQSNIAHQQQILRQQPASPKMKQKHMSHPDPSQSKPFSYFGTGGPAPLVHRHSEGQIPYRTDRSPSDSNYEQVNNYHNGQTRTGYENMSPPHYREPQMGGIGHPSGSPVLQRQSSLTRKASLSPVMTRRHESPRTSNQRSSGQRGPPSFPAPTTPGYVRPVSPPLPPHPVGYDQPPPPPPIEKIPGHQSVTSFELGRKKRQSGETDINRNQVQDPHVQYPRQQSTEGYSPLHPQQGYYPGHQTDPYSPTHQHHNTGLVYQQQQQQPYGAGSPDQQQYYNLQQQQYTQQQYNQQQQQQYTQQQHQQYIQQQQQQQYTQQQMSSQVPYAPPVHPVSGGGLADQLTKVKLKSKSVSVEGSEEKKAGELAAELGKVKLKPAKPKENMSPPPEKTEESPAGFLTKLKPTGAKPWEKDTSPEQIPQHEIEVEDQFDEDYFPPPPPDLEELPPPEPVNGFRTAPTSSKPQQKKGGGAPSLSKMANIEIDLNNIDYNQIPGYTPITAAVPNWKRDMIEKKNQEKVEEYIVQLRRQKEEQEKWKDVPEWKRKILMEKAQLKQNEDFEVDEARKQKEKKKFESPDQVKLKPVKPKSESQPKETLQETPIAGPMDTKPLQEIKQNIPAFETKKPEVLMTIQTKKIVLVETNKLPPPPPPAVVEKPKKSVPVPDPDLPPPPPPPDVMDEGEREDERRRREERRREIEAQMDQEEDSGEIPAWKKEIMMKRGGAIKNWGDEREDINEIE